MELRLRNIGPISDISFDVDSDLTFIYGKNNIGKSYAITLLYLVLKNYAFESPIGVRYAYAYDYLPVPFIDSKEAYRQKLDEIKGTEADVDITELVNRYFCDFIAAVFSENLENSLRSSFGDIENLSNKISNAKFEIDLRFKDFGVNIKEDGSQVATHVDNRGRKYVCRKAQRHLHPRPDGDRTMLYYNDEKQFLQDLRMHVFSYYRRSVTSILNKINNVYYLPASRSGLYRALNAFSLTPTVNGGQCRLMPIFS